jgi:DNA-directed RNA polymerase subunit RPC12/RpoP
MNEAVEWGMVSVRLDEKTTSAVFCPCGGCIYSLHGTLRYVVYRCRRCWLKFRGPYQNDTPDPEFKQIIERRAYTYNRAYWVAQRLMA